MGRSHGWEAAARFQRWAGGPSNPEIQGSGRHSLCGSYSEVCCPFLFPLSAEARIWQSRVMSTVYVPWRGTPSRREGSPSPGVLGSPCSTACLCHHQVGPSTCPHHLLPPKPRPSNSPARVPGAVPQPPEQRHPALGPASLALHPLLSGQPGAQPVLERVQRFIEGDIVPLPGVDLVAAYVGEAVDDVGAEEGVDGVREAAPQTVPVLGPVGVVADQFGRRAWRRSLGWCLGQDGARGPQAEPCPEHRWGTGGWCRDVSQVRTLSARGWLGFLCL